MSKAQSEIRLEPVAAYNRIAPEFTRLSQERRAYLHGIEQLVVSQIPPGSRSLLDVGAGDGARAVRIAQAGKIEDLMLLEPSEEMRRRWPPGVRGWAMHAEDLRGQQAPFDVITCLWNVLGHVFPAGNRVEVLRQLARLLSPGGLLFIDVSHRYNARHYGVLPTLLRLTRDRFSFHESTGDVTARWEVDGTRYATNGHVFTHREFRRLSQKAGLTIKKCLAVDYRTGEIRRWKLEGHLFYVLQRTGLASPKTRQT
jgi:2-polyprenyl-3-methyl-5-hydroxy-6-metoxy-1,4-benzoquinol methylase